MKPSEILRKSIENSSEHPHVVVLQSTLANILDEMREQINELQAISICKNSVKDKLL